MSDSKADLGGMVRIELSAAEEKLLLHILAVGLPEPKREYRFHPVRRFRFDLAWPVFNLAVEVEGGQYIQGRHMRPAGFERDCVKYNLAQLMGWLVLRYTPDMIERGEAVADIERVLGA